MPVAFARDCVIESANRDLVIGSAAGVPVSQDGLHSKVTICRLGDPDGSLRVTGYAAAIALPDVAELPWEAIQEIRMSRGLQMLRGVLRQVEMETAEIAIKGGDLERAVHLSLAKHQSRITSSSNSVGAALKRTAIGFFIGSGAGVATSGLTGPAGIVAGSALGSVVGVVQEGGAVIRSRRGSEWLGLLSRLQALS